MLFHELHQWLIKTAKRQSKEIAGELGVGNLLEGSVQKEIIA
jgi:hypothetical protein